MTTRNKGRNAAVQIGYAADAAGEGIAYALLAGAAGETSLRTPFRVRRVGGLGGREVAFAALTAVLGALRARGTRSLDIEIADDTVAAEIEGRRPIPPALAMPYVTLRCALNGFGQARIRSSGRGTAVADLEARARAEVSLHVAA